MYSKIIILIPVILHKMITTIQVSITWKKCAELPIKFSDGKTTVINGKIYCGGGWKINHDDDGEYIVYCYDPSQDQWTTLPPLPVKYFSLGQVSGKLVAVGGQKSAAFSESNEVLTYDEQRKIWKKTIPPMPRARSSPGVLSLQSALVVAGGYRSVLFGSNVEVFRADTLQWYGIDPLPVSCNVITLVTIGNICYGLGGYDGSHLNQALYASIDDLLGNAVPANQTTHSGNSGSSETQSAWKTLPNTPTYRPAAAVLASL